MKNRLLNNNSGYSLVELIIVIGIIAVLTGLAGFTISAISTSKATAAMQNFDTELSALSMRTKSQDGDNAILLKREGEGYKIYYGTSSDGTTAKWSQTSTSAEASLNRVDIYYTEPGGSATKLTGDMIIKFKKSDGSVLSGEGLYEFNKYGSNKSVGRITLNKSSGSHYFGK